MEHAETKHLERPARFDLSSEGQHYRMAELNLLAPIVIYWNRTHLGAAVRQWKHAGQAVEPELLGPHPTHRRIPVAKVPIATLTYDSSPYWRRPGVYFCDRLVPPPLTLSRRSMVSTTPAAF